MNKKKSLFSKILKDVYFFSSYTSITLQIYSSLFSIVSSGRNVARTTALAKAIVR